MKTKILSLADIKQIVEVKGLDVLMDEMINRLTYEFTTFNENETKVPTLKICENGEIQIRGKTIITDLEVAQGLINFLAEQEP